MFQSRSLDKLFSSRPNHGGEWVNQIKTCIDPLLGCSSMEQKQRNARHSSYPQEFPEYLRRDLRIDLQIDLRIVHRRIDDLSTGVEVIILQADEGNSYGRDSTGGPKFGVGDATRVLAQSQKHFLAWGRIFHPEVVFGYAICVLSALALLRNKPLLSNQSEAQLMVMKNSSRYLIPTAL